MDTIRIVAEWIGAVVTLIALAWLVIWSIETFSKWWNNRGQ